MLCGTFQPRINPVLHFAFWKGRLSAFCPFHFFLCLTEVWSVCQWHTPRHLIVATHWAHYSTVFGTARSFTFSSTFGTFPERQPLLHTVLACERMKCGCIAHVPHVYILPSLSTTPFLCCSLLWKMRVDGKNAALSKFICMSSLRSRHPI